MTDHETSDRSWKPNGREQRSVTPTSPRSRLRLRVESVTPETWPFRAERNAASGGSAWIRSVTVMLSYDRLRSRALALTNEVFERLGQAGSESRALEANRREGQHHKESQLGLLRVQLGLALVASGDTLEGAQMLKMAVARRWEPAAFKVLAEVDLAVGDTLSALQSLSFVSIDPVASDRRAWADSLVRKLQLPADEWNRWLSQARGAMRYLLLANETDPKPIARGVSVQTTEGQDVQLRELLLGKVTIVVFWSRFSWPSLERLPEVEDLYRESQQFGIDVVLLTTETPNPGLRSVLSNYAPSVPFLHDLQRQAKSTFRVHGTPHIAVTDHVARIRFETSSLPEALRRAVSLAPERQLAARAGQRF